MENTKKRGDPVARSRDVRTRAVFLFGFWLGLGTLAAALGIWGFFHVLARAHRGSDRVLSPLVAANLQRTPPEPRLEPNPLAPRLKMRAEEDRLLDSYGWIDKQAGVVRVPIGRAMDLLAERGLPPAKPMAATAPAPAPSGAGP